MFTPTPLRRNLRAALRDLSSHKAEVRASAAQDLGVVGCEDPGMSAQALSVLLRDPVPAVRREAALALGTLGVREHVDALVTLLEDPDSGVRQCAVMALGQLGGEAARAALERALTGPYTDVRYQVLLALVSIDPPRGFEVCLEALGDEDVWIASEAALQLGTLLATATEERAEWCTEMCRARAREALRARIDASSGRVALCAAMALAQLGDDRGSDKIVAFVRGQLAIEASEDLPDLRLLAIERLGDLGGSAAVAALEGIAWRLLGSAERDVARAALARLGDLRAREKIVAQLSSWSAAQRQAAVAMARLGRVREAVPLLLSHARHRRVDPVAVVEALGSIADEGAVRALEQIVHDGTHDDETRHAARSMLARMGVRV